MGRACKSLTLKEALPVLSRIILMVLMMSFSSSAQDKNLNRIKSKYLFEPVLLVDLNSIIHRGQLTGITDDSIFVITESGMNGFAFSELARVKLTSNTQDRGFTTGLALIGAFLSQFILDRPENPADRFVETKSYLTNILAALTGFSVFGALGYGIDAIKPSSDVDLLMNDPKAEEKLRKELLEEEDKTKLHVHYQMSHVYSLTKPYSKYSYSDADYILNFNTFRRARITYSISNRFEAGIAFGSAAEPNLKSWETIEKKAYTITTSNELIGFYLTGSYSFSLGEKESVVSLVPVVGVGFSLVDYSVYKLPGYYVGKQPTGVEIGKYEKTEPSCFGALELRFQTAKNTSIALVADYIFVPGHAPESPISGESGKSFSTFSLGLSLGIHL